MNFFSAVGNEEPIWFWYKRFQKVIKTDKESPAWVNELV